MITSPLDFSSKSSQVYVQPFASFNSTGSPEISPSAYSCTSILSGLYPSWSLLSFQDFNTTTSTFPGKCLFVISIVVSPVSSSTVLSISVVYSGTETSSIV